MTTSSVLLLSVDEIFALKTPERKKDFLDSALREENIRTGWCMNRTFFKRKKEKKKAKDIRQFCTNKEIGLCLI